MLQSRSSKQRYECLGVWLYGSDYPWSLKSTFAPSIQNLSSPPLLLPKVSYLHSGGGRERMKGKREREKDMDRKRVMWGSGESCHRGIQTTQYVGLIKMLSLWNQPVSDRIGTVCLITFWIIQTSLYEYLIPCENKIVGATLNTSKFWGNMPFCFIRWAIWYGGYVQTISWRGAVT